LQALVLEREQDPPRVRTTATPVNVDRHSYIRLKCWSQNIKIIVTATAQHPKCEE
jgi:hypothetical protein